MDEAAKFEIRYERWLDAGGWTTVYHLITLDRRISDGAYRLYLLLHRYAQGKACAWPSRETLARDLGVSVATIRRRLEELSEVGLIERRKEHFGGVSVTYILDPHSRYAEGLQQATQATIGSNLTQLGDNRVKFDPSIGSNLTHEEIIIEEEEEEEKRAEEKNSSAQEIRRVLEENGVFPEAARQIAEKMNAAGIAPEDALRILLETIQFIQSGARRGDGEVMSIAVSRLRRGVWDAGRRARHAIHHSRWAATAGPAAEDAGPAEIADPAGAADPAADPIWQAALRELQLELTRATFETWLRNSHLVACEDSVFVIGVANTYARDWLESRLRPVVERVLTRLTGRTASVRFVVWEGR